MKPATPTLQSTCLLDQLRERILSMHYSLSTEKAYLCWIRFFIRWHGRGGQMKHPCIMGAPVIEAFRRCWRQAAKYPLQHTTRH